MGLLTWVCTWDQKGRKSCSQALLRQEQTATAPQRRSSCQRSNHFQPGVQTDAWEQPQHMDQWHHRTRRRDVTQLPAPHPLSPNPTQQEAPKLQHSAASGWQDRARPRAWEVKRSFSTSARQPRARCSRRALLAKTWHTPPAGPEQAALLRPGSFNARGVCILFFKQDRSTMYLQQGHREGRGFTVPRLPVATSSTTRAAPSWTRTGEWPEPAASLGRAMLGSRAASPRSAPLALENSWERKSLLSAFHCGHGCPGQAPSSSAGDGETRPVALAVPLRVSKLFNFLL